MVPSRLPQLVRCRGCADASSPPEHGPAARGQLQPIEPQSPTSVRVIDPGPQCVRRGAPDGPRDRRTVHQHADGRGVERKAVHEVCCPVHRVDRPGEPRGRRATKAALFAEDGVVRMARGKAAADERLYLLVHLRDSIVRCHDPALIVLVADGDLPAECIDQPLAGQHGKVIGGLLELLEHARDALLRDRPPGHG